MLTGIAFVTLMTAVLANSAPAQDQAKPADLKIGNMLDVTSWDPANADIGFDGPYMSAIYDPLVALSEDGKVLPVLATSWSYSDDRLKLTMKLRTDAKFSDGSPVDAQAVVANLEHLKQGSRSSEAYLDVASIKAQDQTTVEIALNKRSDTMLYLMALGRSYMASPAAIKAGTLATAPVGSGPYLLDSKNSVAGSEYRFTKVDNHWDSKRYPFKSVSVYPIIDPTARYNAMLTGQLNVSFADALTLQQGKQQGWNSASAVAMWVGLQFVDHGGKHLAPLGDVRVRQALNYAFDGAAILKSLGSNDGAVSNQVFPVGRPGNDPSLNAMYAFNIKKAKELLAEAGYAKGFDVRLPMCPIFARWQPIVEQTFQTIGIRVTWDNMQMPDYMVNSPKYPMFIAVLAMDNDPAASLARQLATAQWYNPSPDYASVPELKGLVDEAFAAVGDDQVKKIVRVNKKLTELAWWSVWYHANNTYFSVPGIKVTPITGLMFPTLRYIQPQ